ncbi:hypothetical protein MW887_010006 [Aspergillus wentii]|nr:hypothetical protein MW887_010006 [Aspergillus wentii]
MPRPRRPGAPEPKRRSRKGCWPCKARKVKCGEEKPSCLNCRRQREPCDYSIRLNWEGRTKRNSVESPGSSSGHSGGFVFSLPLSPPAPVQPPSSSNTPRNNSSLDLTNENIFWDSDVPGASTPETSYAGGLHDFHGSPAFPGQPLDHFNHADTTTSEAVKSPPQLQDIIIAWPEQSPQSMTPNATESIPVCSSSLSYVDGVQFPSPVDRSSSIAPFGIFPFTPSSVSRPTSFLRQSMETSKRSIDISSEYDDMVSGQQAKRPKVPRYPFLADTLHFFPHEDSPADISMNLEGGISSHPRKMSLSSSYSAQQNTPTSSNDSPVAVQDIYTKDTPRSLILDNCLYKSSGQPVGIQSSQAGGVDEEARQTDGSASKRKWHVYLTSVTDNYGLDRGSPDLDLNKNDDHAAIDINSALDLINSQWKTPHVSEPGNAQAQPREEDSYSRHSYYVSPVPINIPRCLSPLPSTLLGNPINLMYFHHFINHTARMLVPHDCDDNPFISVLPSMAIMDSNLLNLTLAYSASHRARYLDHPEPSNRIAHWVSNVFPTLRLALDDPHENVTDTHLATAIMLLSLKIISPSTFEVPIPWQSHLKLARDLFNAHGEQMAYPGNRIGAFFARWLGYIDIMGALSCRLNEPPLLTYHSVLTTCCPEGGNDDFCIDCFTGFTPRTGVFLSRLGKLVHQCDNQRFDDMGTFRSDWRPPDEVVLEAESLITDVEYVHMRAHASGKHYQNLGSTDIVAIDQAFRFAGILHLHRRVLGTSPYSSPVKEALDQLTEALRRIKTNTPAEVGVLFPLFTAGCETQDPQQKKEILERFRSLEKTGMKQIQNARKLMQRCWDEDSPWITLAQGEFLG